MIRNFISKEIREIERMGGRVSVVGKSPLGREIYSIEIGQGDDIKIIYEIKNVKNASIGLEHAKQLLREKNHNAKYIVIPLANPDELLSIALQTR